MPKHADDYKEKTVRGCPSHEWAIGFAIAHLADAIERAAQIIADSTILKDAEEKLSKEILGD